MSELPLFENAPKHTHNRVLELLKDVRPDAGRVLDIPSGSGAFARRLVELSYQVYAGDVVDHGQPEGVTFQQANMNEPLDMADDSVACVTCIEGIEHLERPFDFVRECRRVLQPDGLLVITTPNTSALRSRWRYFLTGYHNKCKYMLDENAPNPLHHINMLSFPQLRYLLHTNGFRVETITTNRIKGINWLYLPLALVQLIATRIGIARAKPSDIDPALSHEVLRQMTSLPLLLGESMIVTARPSEQHAS
ncbi:MAG: class I SAM-dependent methyltransferase [Pseudomonadota bacterium]